MKVKNLLKQLDGLDDFDIILRERDETDTVGISYIDCEIQIDVGYSDKVIIIGKK